MSIRRACANEAAEQRTAYSRRWRANSASMFIAALVTGLIVSIFQAATQINEATLSFVPKLVVIFITLIVAGPWMITMMTDYMRRLYESIPSMIG